MVYVLFSHGFEEIEAITVIDVLRRAEIDVLAVGVGSKTILGAHNISVNCDILAEDIDLGEMKMLVLPGGMPGTLNLKQSSEVQSMIDYAFEKNITIAAICAAPSILGHKGLLDGKRATCFPGFESQLGKAEHVLDTVVQDGMFITGKGPGTAIEFSLCLVKKLIGIEKANGIAAAMQWSGKL